MASAWRGWVQRWRARAVAWLRAPLATSQNPYRTAAPELLALPTREARMRADALEGWRAGRASVRATLTTAHKGLRTLWTLERLLFIPGVASLGAVSGGLAASMMGLAPFVGARLSTTATHVAAIPCGLTVGLCMAVAILAMGAVALLLTGLLAATAVLALYTLAMTAYGLLGVSLRVALGRARARGRLTN